MKSCGALNYVLGSIIHRTRNFIAETFEVDISNTKKLLEGERGQLIAQKDIIVSNPMPLATNSVHFALPYYSRSCNAKLFLEFFCSI